MIRFFSILSLLFGNGMTQINPIRDPALTVAPTIGPVINTIGPIRTIQPIRTISPGTVVINRTTTIITSSTSILSDIQSSTDSANEDTNIENAENADNLTLIYALVPTGILALLLVLLCIRRKRAINNNNVVNIDLNIENVLHDTNSNNNSNSLVKQQSVDSNRFSNHIYEEVDYEARYEMPTIVGTETAGYENVFNGDKGPDNEYGKQVTTIV